MRKASTRLPEQGTQTRLLRNQLTTARKGRCSEFWNIAFLFFNDEILLGEARRQKAVQAAAASAAANWDRPTTFIIRFKL